MSDVGAGIAAGATLFEKGEVFHGYEVECPLGRGGLGSVWLVRHQMLDKLFALKTLDPVVAREKPEYVRRFVREAKLASKIRHPNLVAVHDAGYAPEKGVYFLVMDYVKGDTLRTTVAIGGPRPEREAVEIILRVADVLATAQRYGMVHRDLKPENIMITPDGTVKLLDLGVAKASGGIDSLRTMANSVFGTPAYISPEQAVDSSAVDVRADVYSLGVILFELLCGRRPYDGTMPAELMRQLLDPAPIPDVRQFKEDVSPAVAEMLQKMCAKRPEERIGSPKEVIEGFARIGYRLEAVAERTNEESGEPASETSMKDLLSGVQAKGNAASDSLDLNTQDAEIREFTAQLRRKRIVRLVTRIAAAGVTLAVLCWLAYRLFCK